MKIRQSNHGYTGTKIYNSWRAMKQRCYDKSQYTDEYQGKGIKVCDEWKRFKPFLLWAEQNGYVDGLTIDRINPGGHYCPENCRWITKSENSRLRNYSYDYSKRDNSAHRKIKTNDGTLLSVREYCESKNIPLNTLRKKMVGRPKVVHENVMWVY